MSKVKMSKAITDTTLLDASPIPTWIYCPATLTFMYVNEAATKTYGYSKKEFAGMTLKDIRPEEDIQSLLNGINNDVRPNITLPQTSRWRHRRKDGSIFYVEMFSSYIEYNDCNARMVQAIDIDHKVREQQQTNALNDLMVEQKGDIDYLLASINEVMWIAYADNLQLLYTNTACLRLYGYTDAEMIADNNLFYNAIHPEDLPIFQSSLRNMLKTGVDECEFRIRHKDGSIRHTKGTAVLRKGTNGARDTCCGITVDITDLKHAQQRTEQVLNSITDGFFALNANWEFSYVNNTFKKIFAGGREEVLGKNYWQVFPKAVHQKFHTEYHRAVKENISVHFEEFSSSLNKWVMVSAYPMNDGLAVYFTDITEQHELRLNIAKQEHNLYALINNTQDLIWSVDRNLHIISVNTACQGYVQKVLHSHMIPGGPAAVLSMRGEEREKWMGLYNRAFSGESFRATELHTSPTGANTYWDITFNPIISPGGSIMGASCFATDMTEHRSYMQQIEIQNARLKEIAEEQSHQVRGPLATIMGLQQLFNLQQPSDPSNIEILSHIQAASTTLDDMIRNIDKKTRDAWPEV